MVTAKRLGPGTYRMGPYEIIQEMSGLWAIWRAPDTGFSDHGYPALTGMTLIERRFTLRACKFEVAQMIRDEMEIAPNALRWWETH